MTFLHAFVSSKAIKFYGLADESGNIEVRVCDTIRIALCQKDIQAPSIDLDFTAPFMVPSIDLDFIALIR
jgi:hypothetical protein